MRRLPEEGPRMEGQEPREARPAQAQGRPVRRVPEPQPKVRPLPAVPACEPGKPHRPLPAAQGRSEVPQLRRSDPRRAALSAVRRRAATSGAAAAPAAESPAKEVRNG